MTALVPSETACLASSPGRMSLTDVWISRDEIVDFLLYAASLEASVATRSKISADYALLVGISGMDGSGKGFISAKLADALRAASMNVALITADDWLNVKAG